MLKDFKNLNINVSVKACMLSPLVTLFKFAATAAVYYSSLKTNTSSPTN